MTSRLVTVDLILSLSLRLRQWEPLPMTEAGSLDFYTYVREMLNRWATQLEMQGLSVSLGTIAENAVQVYQRSEGEPSWPRLINIGDQLIERAREIEGIILNRSAQLLSVPIQEEIAKALTEGEPVKFTQAAADIVTLRNSTKPLKNPTEARNRLKEFLTWIRDYARDDERSLINDVIEEKRELTTSAVELFKRRDYFPFFNGLAQ
jgi:hypothetical protein